MGASGSRPNVVFQSVMDEFGYTSATLAHAMEDLSAGLTGAHVPCDSRTVSRWRDGVSLWPHYRFHPMLEQLFGRSMIELGFVPRSPKSTVAWPTARTPTMITESSSVLEVPAVLRRDFMGASSITILGTTLPMLPNGPHLGAADVARLRTAAEVLDERRLQGRSASVVDTAEQYITGVKGAIATATRGRGGEAQVYSALARLHSVAGFSAFDANDGTRARGHFNEALRYAGMADDWMQQAMAYSDMARLEIDRGNGAEVVDLANTALRLVGKHPHISVVLYTRLAVGHAQLRDKRRMGRYLAQTEMTYDRVKPENSPPWLSFCGPTELSFQSSMSHFEVGRFAEADRLAERSLSGEKWQSYSFADYVLLARAKLAGGNVDQAIHSASTAVALLSTTRFPRWETKLAEFRARVVRFDTPAAADFAEKYDQRVRSLA